MGFVKKNVNNSLYEILLEMSQAAINLIFKLQITSLISSLRIELNRTLK